MFNWSKPKPKVPVAGEIIYADGSIYKVDRISHRSEYDDTMMLAWRLTYQYSPYDGAVYQYHGYNPYLIPAEWEKYSVDAETLEYIKSFFTWVRTAKCQITFQNFERHNNNESGKEIRFLMSSGSTHYFTGPPEQVDTYVQQIKNGKFVDLPARQLVHINPLHVVDMTVKEVIY